MVCTILQMVRRKVKIIFTFLRTISKLGSWYVFKEGSETLSCIGFQDVRESFQQKRQLKYLCYFCSMPFCIFVKGILFPESVT